MRDRSIPGGHLFHFETFKTHLMPHRVFGFHDDGALLAEQRPGHAARLGAESVAPGVPGFGLKRSINTRGETASRNGRRAIEQGRIIGGIKRADGRRRAVRRGDQGDAVGKPLAEFLEVLRRARRCFNLRRAAGLPAEAAHGIAIKPGERCGMAGIVGAENHAGRPGLCKWGRRRASRSLVRETFRETNGQWAT